MIPAELEAEIDDCCDRFESQWQAGDSPDLEGFLSAASEAARPYLLWELVALERYYRRDARGEAMSIGALASVYPALADDLLNKKPPQDEPDTALPDSDVALASNSTPHAPHPSRGLHVRCPHCSNGMEIVADSPLDDVTCHTCGSTFNLVDREGPTEKATTLRRLGRFDLISRLGVGGFGTVWKAKDSELDRLVALKIPRKGQLTKADIEQFFREARAAAQLYHPNIVSVFEVGREQDTVFIVSDLVRGMPLSDYLTGNKPNATEVATLGVAVCDALQHAHDHGVIHRDLKPSNIMLDQNNRPLIMDFGLAKRDVGEITMTVEGQILGTPGYMSPEQASGKSHWTDRRSDVYSLGTVYFRILTGELPFRGNARMQLHQKLAEDPPDPRSLDTTIPRDLSTICWKCIQRDPNGRYATAGEVGAELQRFLDGKPIRARPLTRTERVVRWTKRRPALASAIVLGVGLAIAGPVAAWQQREIAQQERNLRQEQATRIAEREGLIAQQTKTLDKREASIEALRDKLALWTGEDSGVEIRKLGWRTGLIQDLVTARQAEMSAVLDDQSNGEPPIYAGLGLGILLSELERDEEALKTLAATELRISALRSVRPEDDSLHEAHADCLHRIAILQHNLGQDAAAFASMERAIVLRKQLIKANPAAVNRQVRLFESTTQRTALREETPRERFAPMLEAEKLTKQIEQHWPTTPAEFYRLACQLVKCDILLNEQD